MAVRLLAALAAFVCLPSLALAQAPPIGQPPQHAGVYAPEPGTQFSGTLLQGVSSKTAHVGDQVVLVNVNSLDGSITGARMFGRVAATQHAGQGQSGQVYLSFDTLQLANGAIYPIAGEVTQVNVKTANNGAKEALGALGGMIVGNIFGKWLGTNYGGVFGAAGGYLVAKNNRADVSIPANSNVDVRLVPPRPQEQDRSNGYAPAEPQPQNVPPPPENSQTFR
ncbi:MAG TPA: hypothetical protein VMD07_03100 [Candidatus Acidoferrales bacterium]|nr:hypothetical protein [Candidatus Acidoferrales bacterium]